MLLSALAAGSGDGDKRPTMIVIASIEGGRFAPAVTLTRRCPVATQATRFALKVGDDSAAYR
jgi:hypothetical protein